MKIVLMGYMGSGKSTIGKYLSEKLQVRFIDLDSLIEKEEGASIPKIFDKKGIIYFRNAETRILSEIMNLDTKLVVSLGGGTPCYSNNLEVIKQDEKDKSIYLKGSIPFLTDRLFAERHSRPLIADINSKELLMEFVGKHIFERSNYYLESNITIDIDKKTPEEITQDIISQLF